MNKKAGKEKKEQRKHTHGAESVAQMVQHLPSKCKILGSNPQYQQTNKLVKFKKGYRNYSITTFII